MDDEAQRLRNDIAAAGAKLAELLVPRLTPENRAKYDEHVERGLGRVEVRVRVNHPGRPETTFVLVPNSAHDDDELIRL